MNDQIWVWVNVTHVFSATAVQVFDGLLDVEIMQSAFFGYNRDREAIFSQSNPVVGGHFSYMANLDGRSRSHMGEYLQLWRGNKMEFTWQTESIEVPASKITIEIYENDVNRTVLLKHKLPADWDKFVMQAEIAWIQFLKDFDLALTRKISNRQHIP